MDNVEEIKLLNESDIIIENKEYIMTLNDKLSKLTSKLSNKELEVLLKYKIEIDYEINYYLNRSYIIRLGQIINNTVIFDTGYLTKIAQEFYTELEKSIYIIDRTLSKSSISNEDIIVYKGINPRKHNEYSNLFGELPKNREPKIDDEITFYTYMSTSLNIDIAIYFNGRQSCCLYRIQIPANMKNTLYLEYQFYK